MIYQKYFTYALPCLYDISETYFQIFKRTSAIRFAACRIIRDPSPLLIAPRNHAGDLPDSGQSL